MNVKEKVMVFCLFLFKQKPQHVLSTYVNYFTQFLFLSISLIHSQQEVSQRLWWSFTSRRQMCKKALQSRMFCLRRSAEHDGGLLELATLVATDGSLKEKKQA